MARVELRGPDGTTQLVAGPSAVDLATVDALARLRLDALRAHVDLRVRGVPDELRELLVLTGLVDLLAD
ncbi:MAG: STAS domain-containing protein [Actinobacteria bacterium]|nr:STAS domain-containing protein [Actinomycetota bacterium]MCA1720437.1 STAS domain-containing protein [Actinomycetota bacterium]